MSDEEHARRVVAIIRQANSSGEIMMLSALNWMAEIKGFTSREPYNRHRLCATAVLDRACWWPCGALDPDGRSYLIGVQTAGQVLSDVGEVIAESAVFVRARGPVLAPRRGWGLSVMRCGSRTNGSPLCSTGIIWSHAECAPPPWRGKRPSRKLRRLQLAELEKLKPDDSEWRLRRWPLPDSTRPVSRQRPQQFSHAGLLGSLLRRAWVELDFRAFTRRTSISRGQVSASSLSRNASWAERSSRELVCFDCVRCCMAPPTTSPCLAADQAGLKKSLLRFWIERARYFMRSGPAANGCCIPLADELHKSLFRQS